MSDEISEMLGCVRAGTFPAVWRMPYRNEQLPYINEQYLIDRALPYLDNGARQVAAPPNRIEPAVIGHLNNANLPSLDLNAEFLANLPPHLTSLDLSTPNPLVSNLQDIQDHKTTDETKQCVVCMDNEAVIVFQCGHKKTCVSCSTKLVNTTKKCPVCRTNIQTAFKVYE